MISKREAALLQAAATIYAGLGWATPDEAVTAATNILSLIQAQEPKPTSIPYDGDPEE